MKTKIGIYPSLLIVYLFIAVTTHAQTSAINNIYEVLDTVGIRKNNRITLSVKWLNDTIDVTQSLKPNECDTFSVDNAKVVLSYGPNCFAHAIDSYFKFNDMNLSDLFDKKTVIFTEALMKILENSFYKVQEFQVKNKRLKRQKELKENSVLVFKNQYETISHAIYYGNGVFYTKNGMFPVQQFTNINKIIKTYWDTKTIDVYQLSPEKEEKFKEN